MAPDEPEAPEAKPAAPEPERPVVPEIIDPNPGPYRRRKRGFSFYFPPRQLIALFGLIIALIAILGLRDSCARGVGNLFKAMEAPDAGPGGATPAPPAPGGSTQPIEVKPMGGSR